MEKLLNHKFSDFGFNFEYSYSELDDSLYSKVEPEKSPKPKLVIFNDDLASELGLNFDGLSDDEIANLFSGNVLADKNKVIAQSYAGHQFGHFVILGDGRAHLIGEHTNPKNQKFDIQLKGSGQTPYSRRGDGRAALAPMLREYIVSEAMHHLGIKTTRSLAVVLTGDKVYRETKLSGAVLTRVAESHIRVGTFQYARILDNIKVLKKLADYTINRHFPEIEIKNSSENPYLILLKKVIDRQIELVCNWLKVGFIHGVMNTDNVSICAETIDYGPCAFLDEYHPEKTFSSIDKNSRYAFINQPQMIRWNLTRFAESLIPLIDENKEKAIEKATQTFDDFDNKFQQNYLKIMRAKLGIAKKIEGDEDLLTALLTWMKETKADYTNTFRDLSYGQLNAEIYHNAEFQKWKIKWHKLIEQSGFNQNQAQKLMQKTNPVIIARNHQLEKALNLAEEKLNFSKVFDLLEALKNPYYNNKKFIDYQKPPKQDEVVRQTFCGT